MTEQGGSPLHQALGVDLKPAPTRRIPPWAGRVALGVVGAIWLAVIAYAIVVDDPLGGEPTAVAAIKSRDNTAAKAETAPEKPEDKDQKQVASAADLEKNAGVTVIRPGAEAPNAVVIRVPGAQTAKLAPAPDPRLIEKSRHGQLPKVAADGARPFDIYARPVTPEAAKAKIRVAVLVSGLGISQSATSEAIGKLPDPVSLGFAPYGTELERSVARARAQGHEVFLQVPMEPFDFPDNDPGPHTLLTTLSPNENVERLHWVMARFPGYVGVVNFTGGRFTASESALAPVVQDIAARGLMIVDDGSSARSLLASAAGNRAPGLKADLVLDASPRPEAIDKQLARLEELARERGVALATASALPVTVERILRWSRTLEGKGIALVPVSSLGGAGQPATTGSIR